MAQAATIDMPEIPLIEEQVDTGLLPLLANYKATYVPGGETKDELLGRFTLYPTRSLPEFDHAYAKAYEARDDFNETRSVYGMVCDNNLPTRTQGIAEMSTFAHANIQSLLGAGTVHCSHLGEARHVWFFERPRGARLSELFRKQTRMHEQALIDRVLEPAIKGLVAMREKKVSHGHIHPHNFFVSETSQLGECYSSPSGTHCHYIYEPLERLMADPLGRGDANEKSDVYALGIMAYEALYGLEKLKTIPREDFIERVIAQSTYLIFSRNRDFSEKFQDFFRGTLNENPGERWGIEQLNQWVGGKRFNMIVPGIPKEATRPLLFLNQEFFSRRVLAHALHTHWRQAIKELKDLRLDRWCEMSLHRPELGEKIDRAVRFAGHGSTDAQLSEALTRAICVLDPTGPLRSHALALRPDAIGPKLAELMQHNGPELQQLIGFIESDLGNFWSEQAEGNKTPEISAAVWRLQKVRPFLKNKALGFGLERALYDLNPSLCCQSPLLKPYHITTPLDALKTLDSLASKLAPDTSFNDLHLAAFIACKTDVNKAVRIHDLESLPELANNPELIVLRMLAKAQQKTPKLQLVGLCAWAGTRIEKMIDTIHNRVIRKRLKLQLKRLANTGNLYEIMTAVINDDVAFRDHDGFVKAIALHQFNHERMDRLKNPAILDYKSKRAGGKMATIISYVVLAITSYITFSTSYGL